jgi:hypothetical protein
MMMSDDFRDLADLVILATAKSNLEKVMILNPEYKHLFMKPGIERDSELAVKLVNERIRQLYGNSYGNTATHTAI